jgi:hypothetical protein
MLGQIPGTYRNVLRLFNEAISVKLQGCCIATPHQFDSNYSEDKMPWEQRFFSLKKVEMSKNRRSLSEVHVIATPRNVTNTLFK